MERRRLRLFWLVSVLALTFPREDAFMIRSVCSLGRWNGSSSSLRNRSWSSPCIALFSSASKNGEGPGNDDANQYQKSYQLSGVGRRSCVKISTNTGHELTTDVPKKMGGSDTAPQPVETLLAAWMGCTQATALFVGRQMQPHRVLIDSLEFVDIQAFRDERGALALPITETPTVPSRLQRVTGIIQIRTRAKEPMSMEELNLLKEQTEIRCPVANMMTASGCAMDVEWIDVTGSD